jgi:hypothetical protein
MENLLAINRVTLPIASFHIAQDMCRSLKAYEYLKVVGLKNQNHQNENQ